MKSVQGFTFGLEVILTPEIPPAKASRQVQRCAELCHKQTMYIGKDKGKHCHLFQYARDCDEKREMKKGEEIRLGRRCVGKETCDARGCGDSNTSRRRKRSIRPPKPECEKHNPTCTKQITKLVGEGYLKSERSNIANSLKPDKNVCYTGCILLHFGDPGADVSDCDKVAWYDLSLIHI